MEMIYQLSDGNRYLPESVELDINHLDYDHIYIKNVPQYKLEEADYLDQIHDIPNRTTFVGECYDYNDIELCATFSSHSIYEVYFKEFRQLPFFNLFIKSTNYHKINIENCDIGKIVVNKIGDNKPMSKCHIYIKNSFVGRISLRDNLYVFSDDRAIIKNNILTRKVCIKESYENK